MSGTVQQVPGFDIRKLYAEAQTRWLKPSEVLFILQNHENFPISPVPPNKPPSGSLFLFNRRVLRFFRKDGHAWQRKKDGRTGGEAHERLKVGNIDALNCYYAHGEENPYFHRRSYWMLDPAYDNIVLVHYREVVEGRCSLPGSSTSLSTNSSATFNQSSSPDNTRNMATCDLFSSSPGSVGEVNSESMIGNNNNDLDARNKSEKLLPYPTLENMQRYINYGGEIPAHDVCDNIPSVSECGQNNYHVDGCFGWQGHTNSSLLLRSAGNNEKQQIQQFGSECTVQKEAVSFWKEMLELTPPNSTIADTQEKTLNPFMPDVHLSSTGRAQAPEQEFPIKDTRLHENVASSEDELFISYEQPEKLIWQQISSGENNEERRNNAYQDLENNSQSQLSAAIRFLLGSDNSIESPMSAKQLQEIEETIPHNTGKSICDGNSMVLNKEDSFEWMDNMQLAIKNTGCSSNISETLFDQSDYVAHMGADSSLTVAQRQLFSIREVSPEWAFSFESTKVIIIGDFLSNYSEIDWKVMFGVIEVPAEIVQNGVIRCQAPPHVAGRVNLCVTSGNRESCSEVREFEYRMKPETSASESNLQTASPTKSTDELLLLTRFAQILLCGCDATSSQKEENDLSQDDPSRKLKVTNDQCSQVIESLLAGTDDATSIINWILQELLKDKLKQWVSSKSQENAITVCSLSNQERSIIHLISGLGFEWALSPILNAGVGVNFRDQNGWTALHWAARFGREKMVAALLATGASAGAVTDPTAQDPVGKTPASIAAANGHKGLAGYLSEVDLTSHLSSLTLKEIEICKGSAELAAERAVESISERNIEVHAGETEDQLSLKDSLAAVRNAAQAAARIQSAFRAHSFRKKKQQEAAQICNKYMTPQEIAELSATSKLLHGHHDQNSLKAALSIQRNYRGWKGRKNFLNLRQHVVKIQAHVRGHQARKKYKEFLWMVSVLEKAVLRWRRRGVGLRGFKVESESIDEIDDNDGDILKIFRKKKVDAALDEAVSRVLSMVESPGARQQYRRMLESYRLAKLQAEWENASEAAGDVRRGCKSGEISGDDMFQLMLDET